MLAQLSRATLAWRGPRRTATRWTGGARPGPGVGVIERHHERLPAVGVGDELADESLDSADGRREVRGRDEDTGAAHGAEAPRWASSQQPKASTDHSSRE